LSPPNWIGVQSGIEAQHTVTMSYPQFMRLYQKF